PLLHQCTFYLFPTLSFPISSSIFFFQSSAAHRHLHSFPTRRSSDLTGPGRRHDAALSDAPAFRARSKPGRLSPAQPAGAGTDGRDRKSTRLNSSHVAISYAVFCLKKKKTITIAIMSGVEQSSGVGWC